jgi:hypothetical protein
MEPTMHRLEHGVVVVHGRGTGQFQKQP